MTPLPRLEPLPQAIPARRIFRFSPGCLYRIETGSLRIVTWDPQGEMMTLNICAVGDVVGMPLCHGCESAGPDPEVECLTRVRLQEIPPESWGEEVVALCRYCQQVQELVCILQLRSVPERLRRLMIWLDRRFGRDTPSGRLLDIPLSHRQLAETLGTTRVTITRLLSRYHTQHKIRRAFRRLIVLDPTLVHRDP